MPLFWLDPLAYCSYFGPWSQVAVQQSSPPLLPSEPSVVQVTENSVTNAREWPKSLEEKRWYTSFLPVAAHDN